MPCTDKTRKQSRLQFMADISIVPGRVFHHLEHRIAATKKRAPTANTERTSWLRGVYTTAKISRGDTIAAIPLHCGSFLPFTEDCCFFPQLLMSRSDNKHTMCESSGTTTDLQRLSCWPLFAAIRDAACVMAADDYDSSIDVENTPSATYADQAPSKVDVLMTIGLLALRRQRLRWAKDRSYLYSTEDLQLPLDAWIQCMPQTETSDAIKINGEHEYMTPAQTLLKEYLLNGSNHSTSMRKVKHSSTGDRKEEAIRVLADVETAVDSFVDQFCEAILSPVWPRLKSCFVQAVTSNRGNENGTCNMADNHCHSSTTIRQNAFSEGDQITLTAHIEEVLCSIAHATVAKCSAGQKRQKSNPPSFLDELEMRCSKFRLQQRLENDAADVLADWLLIQLKSEMKKDLKWALHQWKSRCVCADYGKSDENTDRGGAELRAHRKVIISPLLDLFNFSNHDLQRKNNISFRCGVLARTGFDKEINHHCTSPVETVQKNSGSEKVRPGERAKKYLIVYATEDIPAGEELCLDYSLHRPSFTDYSGATVHPHEGSSALWGDPCLLFRDVFAELSSYESSCSLFFEWSNGFQIRKRNTDSEQSRMNSKHSHQNQSEDTGNEKDEGDPPTLKQLVKTKVSRLMDPYLNIGHSNAVVSLRYQGSNHGKSDTRGCFVLIPPPGVTGMRQQRQNVQRQLYGRRTVFPAQQSNRVFLPK